MDKSLKYTFHPLKTERPYLEHFKGYAALPLKSSPGGWIVRHDYEELYAQGISNMELRENDIWIITFPKSGTTWTQSLIWLLLHKGEFPAQHLDDVSPHLELDQGSPKERIRIDLQSKLMELSEDNLPLRELIERRIQKLDSTPVDLANSLPRETPRLLKSHLPFCFLPPGLVERNKVIFVYRDPRDVVVSYYNHMSLMAGSSFIGSFEEFFEYFIEDEVNAGPFWEYIQQVYEHQGKSNFHFIDFKDMKKDLPSVIRGLIDFLDLNEGDFDIEDLAEKVSLKNMKNNPAVDQSATMIKMGLYNDNKGTFIRQGKVGGWKDLFTPDMLERMNAWTREKTEGTSLPMEKLYPKM